MTSSPSGATSGRRRFIASAAGSCLALGAASAGWRVWRNHFPRAISRTSFALGAEVTMTAVHTDERTANAAMDAAFRELELVESLMSIYRPDSQLSRLNRDKVLDHPHPYLVQVLQYANEVSQRSAGAFDVTVQPLWRLFQEAWAGGGAPSETEVNHTVKQVDWRQVEVRTDKIVLHGNGMAVTLNGLAQGFAADAAMQTMKREGIADALIDTGEFGAAGTNPDGREWGVGIQHPRIHDALASVARLQNRCLATSGDYETTFSSDFSQHHLFDPRSGSSPAELSSVSVVAPTAMAADALSTALFVLGSERGIDLLQTLPDTEALLIQKDGRVVMTPGFPANV